MTSVLIPSPNVLPYQLETIPGFWRICPLAWGLWIPHTGRVKYKNFSAVQPVQPRPWKKKKKTQQRQPLRSSHKSLAPTLLGPCGSVRVNVCSFVKSAARRAHWTPCGAIKPPSSFIVAMSACFEVIIMVPVNLSPPSVYLFYLEGALIK